MNNRLSVGGIFRDLEKAFDCVNHGILLHKLQFYGISRKFLALIQSYLREDTKKYLLTNLTHMMMFLLDGRGLQVGFLRVRSWGHFSFLFI